jgi:hypothetical protein
MVIKINISLAPLLLSLQNKVMDHVWTKENGRARLSCNHFSLGISMSMELQIQHVILL